MASNTDTNAVLLEMFKRHIKNEPQEHGEVNINGFKHKIVNFEVDLLVKDTTSPLLLARVIFTARGESNPFAPEDQSSIDLAAHITINPDHPSSSLVILEIPQDHEPVTTPRRASTIPTHPSTGSTKSLAETYRTYLETFMADPATGEAQLPRFLHQPVTHNGRELTVPAYHSLGHDVRAVIPDLACDIVDLVADEERQVVAARLEFKGTPLLPKPDGQEVRIGEIVFYWFDGARIREVLSLVDGRELEGVS
ncbi:polyketide cyclase [Diaporthe amygdali]|uniref:polyketide cyclase n=1 Tax=Phomopsis amygdali TaxID=1214568 RepID=UPI0022FE02EA|nr:polyketide cyclase [Diaporthe amygdali]KAJ0121986.1 polyketide cyclase [Diaporthe amygdali]